MKQMSSVTTAPNGLPQVDITGAAVVDVVVDHRRGVVHVNCDGICVVRICQIQHPIEVDVRGRKPT